MKKFRVRVLNFGASTSFFVFDKIIECDEYSIESSNYHFYCFTKEGVITTQRLVLLVSTNNSIIEEIF